MTAAGSAQLRDEYERRYAGSGEEGRRYARWRQLGAEGKADHVAALVRHLPAAPDAIVELGCGDGVVLAALAARGVGGRREGFDISERAVELAEARPEVARAERFDGRSLPAADGEYDLALLSHVLEHVPDPVPLLREACRVARAVVVEVPLEDNRSAARPAAQRGREHVGHLHRFDRAAVRALVAAAGMNVTAELADPLPWRVHAFFATGGRARALALVKAGVRRAVFTASPAAAERAFTVHFACLCVPRTGVRARA